MWFCPNSYVYQRMLLEVVSMRALVVYKDDLRAHILAKKLYISLMDRGVQQKVLSIIN